jgi:hypothetical protein
MAEDRAEYRRLSRSESPEFVVDHRDYFALFTTSVFLGRVAPWEFYLGRREPTTDPGGRRSGTAAGSLLGLEVGNR